MIERYTRPELGELWTDQAKMDAWRDVEVAAAEALDGPTPDDLDKIRGATFTVEAVKEREKVTDHDVPPGVHLGLVGPEGAELGSGVARDHEGASYSRPPRSSRLSPGRSPGPWRRAIDRERVHDPA